MAALAFNRPGLVTCTPAEFLEVPEVGFHHSTPCSIGYHESQICHHGSGSFPPSVHSVGGSESLLHRQWEFDALSHPHPRCSTASFYFHKGLHESLWDSGAGVRLKAHRPIRSSWSEISNPQSATTAVICPEHGYQGYLAQSVVRC